MHLLVTGATGLTGSNVCRLAIERGWRVRGLVRSEADADRLRTIGAEPVIGDVTQIERVRAAAEGVDGIVHGAAVLGGTWSTATVEEFYAVNYLGALNVMTAAEEVRVNRTVMVNTAATLSWSTTMTERSPLVEPAQAPPGYIQAKLATFYETMRRAVLGQHLVTVFPAAVYGPAPFVDRALVPTSFNATLLMAIRGELAEYLTMPLAWVYVDDVAEICLRALDAGERGARYLAFGRPEDVTSLPGFCNRGAELAGSSHRVADADPEAPGSQFGSMADLARRKVADPLFDPRGTTAALGWPPTPLGEGMPRTVDWLRRCGRIS